MNNFLKCYNFLKSKIELQVSFGVLVFILYLLIPDILQLIQGNHIIRNISSLPVYLFILIIPLLFKIRSWLYILMLIPLYILSTIQIGYFFGYGKLIQWPVMASIIETTVNESYEFIIESSYYTYFFIFSILFLLFLLSIKVNRRFTLKVSRIIYVLLFLLLFFDFSYGSAIRHIFPIRMFDEYKRYEKDIKMVKSIKYNKINNSDKAKRNTIIKEKETYVLIVGESMTRQHLCMYGYYRNTTPNLSANDHIVWYGNVISPGENTLLALGAFFTHTPILEIQNIQNTKTIISVFNDLNFSTYWISNQPKNEAHDIYSNEAANVLFLKNSYDEDLLKKFENAENDSAKKKFIVINLIGCHSKFSLRYPATFNYYNDKLSDRNQATINAYDNSIRYSDFVISEIIKKVKLTNTVSWVIYFSDHGEIPNGHANGHPPGIYKSQYEIPFFFWYSDEYFTKYPYKIKNICSNKDKIISLEQSFHSICGLNEIKCDDYNKKLDFFDSLYTNTKDDRFVKDVNFVTHKYLDIKN